MRKVIAVGLLALSLAGCTAFMSDSERRSRLGFDLPYWFSTF